MSNRTYGNFPGVKTTVDGNVTTGAVDDDAVGTLTGRHDIELWGHAISFTDDGISCTACDMDEEIPDIVEHTSPGRVQMYRAYVLAKFKRTSCTRIPMYERDSPTTTDWLNTYTTQNPSTSDDYFAKGDAVNIDKHTYTYEHGGYWRGPRGDMMTAESLIVKHGNSVTGVLPDKLLMEAHKGISQRKDASMSGPSFDATATVPDYTTLSDSDGSSDDDSEDSPSLRERLNSVFGR